MLWRDDGQRRCSVLASVPLVGVGSVTEVAGRGGKGIGLELGRNDWRACAQSLWGGARHVQGAALASVRVASVSSVNVVAGTKDEGAVLAYVRLACVGSASHVGGEHDR